MTLLYLWVRDVGDKVDVVRFLERVIRGELCALRENLIESVQNIDPVVELTLRNRKNKCIHLSYILGKL